MPTHYTFVYDSNGAEYRVFSSDGTHLKFLSTEDGQEVAYPVHTPVGIRFP
jgi:hypothetical protein